MSLRILKDGLFTSLQGTGTYGLQRYGINPGGAMDRRSVRALNALLGNTDGDLALELHFPAGEIEFGDRCLIAVGGADFAPELAGVRLELGRVYETRTGGTLRFPNRLNGARCYVAVRGGLWHEELESENRSGRKYFATRRLRKGDVVKLSAPIPTNFDRPTARVSWTILPACPPDSTVRFTAGAEYQLLTRNSKEMLTEARFALSADSNRMGFRLAGPRLRLTHNSEMLSAAVTFGTIQLLPDGKLIVLMADHQTSGGYPRVGNLLSSDLPLMAQLSSGDTVRFREVQLDEAESAAEHLERQIQMLKTGVRLSRFR